MKKGRVLLGMSGGVDSSVSALLLKNEGYEVIGVTLSLSNHTDAKDAKEVCNKLGIEHISIDMQESFKKYVIDNFIDCYANALTPNPCIECNRRLKFGELYKKAKELNCDFLATGHYAKIEYNNEYNQYVLEKCINTNKDQSYVLYTLPQEILANVLFPLGNFSSKDEIRQIAKENNLVNVADKPDSEDICFIPDGNYKKFLEENSTIKPKPGNIVLSDGTVLGKHTGLYNYTIGQRRGLHIGGPGEAWFVCGKDTTKNQLIVGQGKDTELLYANRVIVTDVNIINGTFSNNQKMTAKFRYRQPDEEITVSWVNENTLEVKCSRPVKAITPGQACVFYDGEYCLGGGTIDKVYMDNILRKY